MSKDLLPKSQSIGTLGKPDEIDTFLTLDDISVRQAIQLRNSEIVKNLELSKVPIGLKSLKYTVTGRMKLVLGKPWISFTLKNFGSDEVRVAINDEGELLSNNAVPKNGTINVDMKYPVINALFLEVDSGNSAVVGIYGKEGMRI